MSDSQGSLLPEVPSTANSGVHYDRMIKVVPGAIRNASPAQLKTLVNSKSEMPGWYLSASGVDRHHLKQLLEDRWRLQGEVDHLFDGLQHDIDAFAEPLLRKALKEKFNIDEDPNALSLQLTVPSKIIFDIDTGASVIRNSSLLAAALHNFEASETQDGAFRAGSGVFRNDAQGAPVLDNSITVQQFAALSRALDIGAQYQTHIQARLQPAGLDARRTLQQHSIASEKAAFRYSALVSRLKGVVSAEAYDSLRYIVEGKRSVNLYGRPLLNHRLSLMGFKLTGIVLFSAVSEPSEIKKAVEDLTPQGLKFWLDWSRRLPVLSGNSYERYTLLQNFFANGPQGVVDQALRNEDIYNQSRLNGPVIAYIPTIQSIR